MLNPSIDLAENESIQKNFSISNIYILLNLAFHVLISFFISYYLPSDIYYLNKLISEYFNINISFSITDTVNYLLITYITFIAINLTYFRLSNNYYLTDKRIIIRNGFFAIDIKTIEYNRITDMETKQNFFERFVSFSGDLTVNTAGGDELEIELYNIDSPTELKANINTLRDKIKE